MAYGVVDPNIESMNPADRNNAAIRAGYTKIELSKSKFALVDMDDYKTLSKYNWHAINIRNKWYAYCGIYVGNYKTKHFSMHRIIMKAKKGQQVDHINGNGLDNRKNNLRVCSNMQNNQNKGPQVNNKLGIRGVCLDDRGKYHVTIQIPNRKYKFLGRFDSPIEAGKAYDRAAREYFGEFAYQNYK